MTWIGKYKLETNEVLLNNAFIYDINIAFNTIYNKIFDTLEDEVVSYMELLSENDLHVKNDFVNSKSLNVEIFGHRSNTGVKY